jgi:hypothetical protein
MKAQTVLMHGIPLKRNEDLKQVCFLVLLVAGVPMNTAMVHCHGKRGAVQGTSVFFDGGKGNNTQVQ